MDAKELNIGSTVAERYELLELLGSGGCSKVYLARDQWLEDEIALKLMAPWAMHHPNISVKRFQAEVLLARKLGHPNIVRIYDFGKISDQYCFITMEYVEGKSLSEHLSDLPDFRSSLEESLPWLVQIASALEYAHRQDVIHRDIKPDNIFLKSNGTIKLGDFGSANSIEIPKGITQRGFAVGTPPYMAPEQFQEAHLDARTDIYAFGVLAYEMIVGKVPFESDSLSALMGMHFNNSVPLISERVPEIPLWFQDFVETCMEKEPKHRFADMGEVIRVLVDQQQSGSFSRLRAILRW